METPTQPPSTLPSTGEPLPSRQVRRQLLRIRAKLVQYSKTRFNYAKVKRLPHEPKVRNGSRHNGGYTEQELHDRAMARLNATKLRRTGPAFFTPVELRIWVR
jgi:hypothetical protein